MKSTKHATTVAMLALATACGAASPSESGNESAGPANGTSSDRVGENAPVAPVDRQLLGRVDYDDGNVVTFERFQHGVVVVERGPEGNERHFQAQGDSPVEIFRRLAPGREVPAALTAADSRANLKPGAIRMNAPLSKYLHDGVLDETRLLDDVARSESESANEPARTGQFEQSQGSYPWSSFEGPYCNFTEYSRFDYRRADLNYSHTNIATSSHVTWAAYAANIGDVTVQMCADSDCNPQYNLSEGYATSVYYDAGYEEIENCPPWWDPRGCQYLIFDRYPQIELRSTYVSSNERFHECAWFVPYEE